MNFLDQTAPHVSAFERNMNFGRLEAGLVNLETINTVMDEHEKDQAL
jgi:hypothetical protein